MMQRLQFSNSSQLPTWTSYLPSQNTHNCSLVDIISNNIRSVCQADRALLRYCSTALRDQKVLGTPWPGNTSEFYSDRFMGKWKFLTSFAHVTSIQTYNLCLTQEQMKKCLTLQQQQEVHHILLNCSLSPKAASLLLLIPVRSDLSVWLMCPRTRQGPACPVSQTHS